MAPTLGRNLTRLFLGWFMECFWSICLHQAQTSAQGLKKRERDIIPAHRGKQQSYPLRNTVLLTGIQHPDVTHQLSPSAAAEIAELCPLPLR